MCEMSLSRLFLDALREGDTYEEQEIVATG